MPLKLEQIRQLSAGQKLTTRCKTTNGFGAACRTAYNGRKEILAAGELNCEVTQDSVAQTVTVSVEEKEVEV